MILPSLEMGGMERIVAQLACQLSQRGWRVGVTCTRIEGELGPWLRSEGVPVRVVPPIGAGSWLGSQDLIRALRASAPTIVHTHSGTWFRAALAASRARSVGCLHTVHGLLQQEPWFGPSEKHLAARLSGAVVTVSPSLMEYMVHRAHVPRSKLHLVPNGVDTEQLGSRPRGELRPRLGLPSQALILGTVARLDPIKNLTSVLGPLRQLVSSGIDAYYVVAGEGPERDAIERRAEAAGMASRLRLLGSVDDTAALYPEFDVFVLPSFLEGTSLSLLEAMASRVPSIATRVGGNPAVLADGGAGVLIPPNDEEALTAALFAVLGSPAERERLGLAGRLRVEQQYSLSGMVDRYEALYRQLGKAA